MESNSKLSKSFVLFFLVGVFILSGCHSKNTIYYVASEENNLITLLKEEGFRLYSTPTAREAIEKADKGAAVLLLNENYPEKVQQLSPELLQTIENKQLKVFAEYATLEDSLPAIKEVSLERVVVNDSISPSLRPLDLLSINCGYYFDAKAEHPLLLLAKVAGFDRAEYGLKETPTCPVFYKHGDNLWISTTQLSNFAQARFMPEYRWKNFWEWFLGCLNGTSGITLNNWTSYVAPAYGRTEPLADSARIHSIQKGVEWFYNGHFLVDKSWKADWYDKYQGDGSMPVGPELPRNAIDGDGSMGMLEGHCSAIYADGRQAYRYWLRNDVQGEASMAFAIAGKMFDNPEYKAVSERLIDYSFKEFRDGSRNDPQSPSYGLLGWSVTHKGTYYGDDNARSILGMMTSASLLQENRWDKKLAEAIIANFRTAGIHGFRGNSLLDKELQEKGWRYFHQRTLVDPHPHFEAWMWACYLWLYDKTQYQPLLKVSKDAISRTMEAYPKGWHWTNGIQQERARMILPLAWLYRVEPTDEHRKWLDYMVSELLKNQVECGGIREELGDDSSGMFGKPKSNAAYGLHEAPLIFDNGDPIVDMLYTTNFAFIGLNEAAKATGAPELKTAVDKMSDFLTRIQVRSERFKNVDGAWFRAFNYQNWDYWASNADAGWGAWSTLTGWIQSWIIATQGLLEMDSSIWELTKDSGIASPANDAIKEML